MGIFVVKRDQSAEPFQVEKIARVVKAAGLDETHAQELSKNVENYFISKNIEKVTSLQIRDAVLEELKKMDTYAANMFEWYEKTKEAKHDH